MSSAAVVVADERRTSIIALSGRVAAILAVLGLIVGAWENFLPPVSPDPKMCDPPPIELPHNDADSQGQMPSEHIIARPPSPQALWLGCEPNPSSYRITVIGRP